MTAATAIDAGRRGLLAKVHVAKKQLALTDDSYRDLVHRVTGHQSAGGCTMSQLEDLLREFARLGWRARKTPPASAGRRPLADSDVALKLRALWISAYELGVVEDPREEALSAFVKRVSGGKGRGVDALQWLTQADGRKAIEGLKSWIARETTVDWSIGNPRYAVVLAQFDIIAPHLQPGITIHTLALTFTRKPLADLDDRGFDLLIRRLGERVRSTKGATS